MIPIDDLFDFVLPPVKTTPRVIYPYRAPSNKLPKKVAVTRCIYRTLASRIGVGLHELPAILGCTEEEFISHIEAQFEPWMNWKNRGLSRGRWVVDHIIPVSAYKRVAVERSCTHEEAKRWLTRYTNLRPLCFTANAKKYNHY